MENRFTIQNNMKDQVLHVHCHGPNAGEASGCTKIPPGRGHYFNVSDQETFLFQSIHAEELAQAEVKAKEDAACNPAEPAKEKQTVTSDEVGSVEDVLSPLADEHATSEE